jgi:DNA (cytosine-5)-methyltransferase 1
VIHVADLFAGAGGCSTGLLMAATDRGERVDLVAVNHWPTAVETHTRNHPEARHFCASVETLDPRVAVPGGKLDILIAAPECVFFSSARGGRPIDDQRRASAWSILRWLELLDVRNVLIENVPEMRQWGPLGKNHRPLKAHKGETFNAFIAALRSMHYAVEWKVLNAADYGAATTRRRLFIQAWKIPGNRSRAAIHWPDSTHSKAGSTTLFGGRKRWRGAREIIDWSLPSQSIFTRKKPLQPATIRRILEGLRRFGGPALEPFLVVLRNHMAGRPLDAPVPTIAAGGHVGLAEPVIVKLTHGDRKRERSIDEPLPTITTANRGEIGIAEPFIVQPAHGSGGGRGDTGRVHSVDAPIGTIPASNRFALAEPFLIPFHSEREGQTPRAHSIDEPMPVIPATGDGKFGVVEPFILGQQSGSVARSVEEPTPTIATDGALSLAEPLIAKYNRTSTAAKPVSEPLDTVSTRDRFALVQPVINGYALDIRFRMLQPHELAAAMSFPRSYSFAGNKGDVVRQVGNAVDCSMARALCGAILDARQPRSREFPRSAVPA